MSACIVVKNRNEFVLAVDSARVTMGVEFNNIKDGDFTPKTVTIKRDKGDGNEEKLHQVGKDVAFIAGFGSAMDEIPKAIYSFLDDDEHIDIDRFHQYLLDTYPLEDNILKDYGYHEYGVDIFRFENGESKFYDMSQQRGKEIFESDDMKDTDIFQLYAFGNRTKELYDDMSRQWYELNRMNFYNAFQNNYFEEIGGKISIYRFSNADEKLQFAESKVLDEDGLNYAD